LHTEDSWYGNFEQVVAERDGGNASRIVEFIRFCIAWNNRADGDPEEFSTFSDVYTSGLWSAVSASGKRTRIPDAPMFLGDEVWWRT
jgi:hypothetical protein